MLEERIYKDYIQALKSKERQKVEFLSFLRAELKNQAISLRKDSLEDEQVIEVLRRQKKRLLEAKESAEKTLRQDILDKLNFEISLLDSYLPKPLSKEELSRIVDEAIKETGASSPKDMGKVMVSVLKKAALRAEAKDVAELVREKLSRLS